MFVPSSELNHATVAQQLQLGIAAIDAGQTVIDFNSISIIDSCAVVCMLAWKRHAQQHGVQIEFRRLPTNLSNLIKLYGVEEI